MTAESNTILTTKVDNVRLEAFEAFVYARQIDRAASELLEILNRLRHGALFVGYAPHDPVVARKLYTRLAAAIVSFMGGADFYLSEDGFAKLAAQHAVLTGIFEVSEFENSDFLASAFITDPLETDAAKFQFKSPASMAKFLLVHCLHSNVEMNFDELFKKSAATTFPLWCGMLTHNCVMTAKGHASREKLLGAGTYFADRKANDALMPALADAFMYSSYGVREDKHEVKRHICNVLRNTLLSKGIKDAKPRRVRRDKPVLLIPVEWFNSYHAMFRCFAPSVMQLRERFHLVVAVRPDDIDEPARALFDDILPLSKEVALETVVAQINKLAPDIIWYPSIGMALWWVALSTMRLAPIQVMTLGHPATSMSPNIDYVLAEEGQAPDPSLFREKVITLPLGSWQFIDRADSKEAAPVDCVPAENEIHVAVPANVFKLNVPYLECLRRISERATADVVYHFFPNVVGIGFWQAHRRLREWFPNCLVHQRSGYQEYLDWLATCDLHFCPFPFGGTNSNVDSMLAGLPLLCMDGPQPHTAFDALMLRRVGLGHLVAKTVEEYEEMAARLINSEAYRQHTADILRDCNIREEFFGERKGAAKGAVLRTFERLMEGMK